MKSRKLCLWDSLLCHIVSGWLSENLFTTFAFLIYLWIAYFLLEIPALYFLFLSPEWHINFNFPICVPESYFYGTPRCNMYIHNKYSFFSVNLSHENLIISIARRTKKMAENYFLQLLTTASAWLSAQPWARKSLGTKTVN